MDLDLNLEPIDQTFLPDATIDSLLNDLDTAQEFVEARIRHLEAVNSRQRQRQERNSVEAGRIPTETIPVVNPSTVASIDSSLNLVAKALEIDPEPKRPDDKEHGGGSFYDCSICLEMATDPVLTCCGHLFCWACFYQVPKVGPASKECPVCKGEVSDTTVIPIYGNGGGGDRLCQTESGLKIPPRPKAPRVESLRQQQRVTHGVRHVPIEEALRLIRASMGDRILNFERVRNVEPEGGPRVRVHQVSRVLSESAASLTSLSSALNSAERLVEELETVISSRVAVESPLTRGLTVLGADVDGPLGSGSDSNGAALTVDPSYSQRRSRRIFPRTSDVDGRETRGSRRRRLN